MFKNGLLEENIKIREKGLNKYPTLNTIGYQEFEKYFQKEISLETVKKEIIKNTKGYAKRQRTWFRKHKHAIWTNDYSLILEESLTSVLLTNLNSLTKNCILSISSFLVTTLKSLQMFEYS